jgi:uncharacterized protein (TIGR03790 family)
VYGVLMAPLAFARLGPSEIGILVNDADPASVEVGSYYQSRRGIPASNVIHVSFPVTPTTFSMSVATLDQVRAAIESQAPSVQALAVAWTVPYQVGCMSITTALAKGYDATTCALPSCRYPTRPNNYFDSSSSLPYTDLGLRPAMMLAGTTVDKVKALIDRGIASDGTHPTGTGFMLKTGDSTRSLPRSCAFPKIVDHLGSQISLQSLSTNYIENQPDVFFYFTGLAQVPSIGTNTFAPGAIADHLTSCGGFLTNPSCGQTTVLAWLEDGASGTGATASYGTVVEPCAYTEKFPSPRVVIERYLAGESAIEAYWKSVVMPDEGVFVGEPLAAPFAQ